MTAVMAMEKNDNSIRRFNQVRLYLQVTWLSEICNVLGTLILPDFLVHTNRTETHSKSTLRWPVQGLPPQKSWTEWKYLLRKRFLTSKTGRLADTSLESNLGAFFPVTSNHRRWKWEQTSASTIVENTFTFGNRQRQYTIAEARAGRGQLNINTTDF
jgi:hypothetical protein